MRRGVCIMTSSWPCVYFSSLYFLISSYCSIRGELYLNMPVSFHPDNMELIWFEMKIIFIRSRAYSFPLVITSINASTYSQHIFSITIFWELFTRLNQDTYVFLSVDILKLLWWKIILYFNYLPIDHWVSNIQQTLVHLSFIFNSYHFNSWI